MKQIEYLSIAPIQSAAFQLVSYYWTRTDQKTQEPYQMVFLIAMDKNKARTDAVDFPVYLPAHGNYKSEGHHRMYEKFTAGDPFVAVRLQNLRVYCKQLHNNNIYWGTADSFTVVEDPASLVEEEDLL